MFKKSIQNKSAVYPSFVENTLMCLTMEVRFHMAYFMINPEVEITSVSEEEASVILAVHDLFRQARVFMGKGQACRIPS